MAKQKLNLKTGIEIWDGQPGSGKSYSATDYLLRTILYTRRPVFTNLPLRFRVVRKYLAVKGKDARLARYINPVSRPHFEAFVERNALLSEFAEIQKAQGWSQAQCEKVFCEQEGPHVYKGAKANWFYPGSVFIFDEFHRWADQRMQKDESPAFLTYATMHRHHLHLVILLTQDKMQVSIPWRRNCSVYVHMTDKRRLPFLFGLKLPIAAFAREEYPAELAERGDVSQVKPSATEVLIPALSSGVIWRMYDSFTHLGGYRRLMSKLDGVRAAVEGPDAAALTPTEEPAVAKKRRPIRFALKYAAIAGVVLALGGYGAERAGLIAFNDATAEPTPAGDDAPQSPVERLPVERVVQISEEARAEADPFLPYVAAMGDGYVLIDGRVVEPGDVVEAWTLGAIEVRNGETLWIRSGVERPVAFGVRPRPVATTRATGNNSAADRLRRRLEATPVNGSGSGSAGGGDSG